MNLRLVFPAAAIAAACLAPATSQSPVPDRFHLPFARVVVDGAHYPHSDCKGAGDIDGDGKPDAVFAGSELAWYRWPDWKRTRIAVARSEFTTDMQVADVDGDGDLDLIVPDGPQGEIVWYENPRPNGDPTDGAAWKPHAVGTMGSFVHDLEVGDVNGDGRLDILTRKKDTVLWLQQPDRSFRRVRIATALENGEGSALADINGDGRLDIVQNGYWLECPPDPAAGKWTRHDIDANWPRQLAVTVADMDQDGLPDVLIGPAESRGKLSWYENPGKGAAGKWIEHVIDPDVEYLHTFKVADVNHDGLEDVVAAEMQQSSRRRVTIYYRESSKSWRPQVISTGGSHNLRLADFGGDGDIDILGANWGGDDTALTLWENKLIDRSHLPMDAGWTYTRVDDSRAKWGDFARPFWMKYVGLAFGDADRDGNTDIASGRYFYRNPGGPGKWARADFGFNVDTSLALDVDGDGRSEFIGQALPDLYLLRAADKAATKWERIRIGKVPPTEHVNSQGYRVAPLFGRRQSVLIAGGDGIYAFTVPPRPFEGNWPAARIAPGTSEEGIAVADFDKDGTLDIAAADSDGHTVCWWKNAGKPGAAWTRHYVGRTEKWADRFAAADINGDGRADIVISEESSYAPASVYWFEQPRQPDGEWIRHTLVTQYTTNAMDVVDVNGDGAPDIVTGEHRGSRKLAWWENRNHGAAWIEHVIDTGKENHLGARVFRLRTKGGQLAIAGIAWDTYPDLHLWTRK